MSTKLIVTSLDSEGLTFNNGVTLYSDHSQDCCEHHYLGMSDLTLADFEGLEFDISTDNFFERIEDYGIALKPTNGHPVRIPGYGFNNGYYSADLTLVLKGEGFCRTYDITDCQVIEN